MQATFEHVAGDLVERREVGADVVHAKEGGVFGGEVEEVSAIGQFRVGVRFVPECVVSEVYEMDGGCGDPRSNNGGGVGDLSGVGGGGGIDELDGVGGGTGGRQNTKTRAEASGKV